MGVKAGGEGVSYEERGVLTGEVESGAMASTKKGDFRRRAWWAVSLVAASPEPMFRVMMGDRR